MRMRGANFLAIALIGLAVIAFWLAFSGNYVAVAEALALKHGIGTKQTSTGSTAGASGGQGGRTR